MSVLLKSRTQVAQAMGSTDPKPTEPRIVIRYIVLTNFKSYAGCQKVGPFHGSFSSVVGPNGSGKSNVIDSLLFVFGFRASKMRQGKISALIHNSAQFPNLDSCEVAVHFHEVMDQPGGGHNVIPNTELVISRKAFKNNSSKYYINDRESNFTAVTTLLRERGVDLDHKRFLILQGEVESIAQMKPKASNEHDDGLLEYLEDIIGTSKYKSPIEEAAAEVDALNEVCAEKSGRVQHVEKEKNNLEDKKNRALTFVEDENELARKQSMLYQIFVAECEANLEVTSEAVAEVQSMLQAKLDTHSGHEKVIKVLGGTYQKGLKECEALARDVSGLVKELNKFEQERLKFDEKRKFLADKRDKLKSTISACNETYTEAGQTIQESTEEISAAAEQIAQLEDLVTREESKLNAIRDSLKGKTQIFSDQIAAKQKSLAPWQAKIAKKESTIAIAESELAILRDKTNAGAIALDDISSKIAAVLAERDACKEQIQQYEAEKYDVSRRDVKLEKKLAELSEQEVKGRKALSNARQKADEARSSLRQNQTRSEVLAALMRMKESGRIDGFHGRLGNLAAIDAMYDVAISTACPALDNFVTDTVEAAQRCIEYLRKNNLGRGNFICLDKLRQRDLSLVETPESAPRLFDLVKCKDKRFLPAFYHALQDTLVAQDLTQANRIAYGAKRWRVVTIDGELIDKSGTMSGGGTSKKRGLMSSELVDDISEKAVHTLEERRDDLEARFSQLLEHRHKLEQEAKANKESFPRLDVEMQKTMLELIAAEKKLADLEKRKGDIGRDHQPGERPDDTRMAMLENSITTLRTEVEALHQETSSIESEIKGLQGKIMEAGGEALRAQKAAVDDIKSRIAEQTERASSAEIRKAKAEKQKAKAERDQAKATMDLDSHAAELEKLENDVETQGDQTESYRSQISEAEQLLDQKRQDLAGVKRELDDKTTELNTLRASEIDMRNKLEENQRVLADHQKKLQHWRDKISKLVLKDIDDLMVPDGGTRQVKSKRKKSCRDKKGKPKNKRRQDNSAGRESASVDADGDVEMDDFSSAPVDGGKDADGDEIMQEAATDDNSDNGGEEDEDEEDEENEEDEEDEEEDGEGEGEGEDDDDNDNDESKPSATIVPNELPRYSRDELAGMSKTTLKGQIAALEEKIQNSESIDLGVLSEYRRRVEEHAARSSDLNSAVASRDAAKQRCDQLRRMRLEGFMTGFSAISLRLKEMYQMITMGGNAELELVDSLDPFSEGILFSVMPPKKSWKNISNLSGGEKTLSSLALVFALHHYRPTPLYVMDEIDAALDFRNVSIVASYIRERTRNAQFIVISLRNNMFELAARLVGVYKVSHMTKSVTIDNHPFNRYHGSLERTS